MTFWAQNIGFRTKFLILIVLRILFSTWFKKEFLNSDNFEIDLNWPQNDLENWPQIGLVTPKIIFWHLVTVFIRFCAKIMGLDVNKKYLCHVYESSLALCKYPYVRRANWATMVGQLEPPIFKYEYISTKLSGIWVYTLANINVQ